MSYIIKKMLKHNLLWLMMISILLFGIYTIKNSIHTFVTTQSTQHMFPGDGENVYYPGLDFAHIQSHDLQKYVEKLIENKVLGRDNFIHAHNQLYYSLFRKTFALSNTLVIGKHHQLFQFSYINAYCNEQAFSHSAQVAWVKKIKEISNFFEKKGIIFLYLITPSKAEYMPSAIPKRFHCKNVGISQRLLDLETILKAYHVRYVNGATMMVDATKKYKTSMFPKGGTHWNDLGASIAANKVIAAINQSHRVHIPKINFTYKFAKVEDRKSLDADDDLLRLMGLLKPDLSYIVPKVNFIKNNIKIKPVIVTVIGGSFIENLANVFMPNNSFAKITHYFYYDLQKRVYKDRNPEYSFSVNVDPATSSELKEILSSNVIILEENSSLLISGHANMLYTLVKKLKENKM